MIREEKVPGVDGSVVGVDFMFCCFSFRERVGDGWFDLLFYIEYDTVFYVCFGHLMERTDER